MADIRREHQARANAAILDTLREQGDALTGVREIDHWAYFPTANARAQFIQQCLEAGLRLRGTRDPQDPRESFSARTFHQDAPDEECIEQVTFLLMDLAEKAGGEYDGWETRLV